MPGDSKTQIAIAILGLVGVLGAAIFANWDKVFGKESPKDIQSAAPLTREPAPPQVNNGDNNIQISGSNNVVNPPPKPKPCRNKAHGIERFAKTFNYEKKSNWMGGGYSQDPWCNDVANELRAQHPDGEFNVLAKSEESRTSCPPLNCTQYQYYCKIEANIEPIYFEKLSAACN